jgi:ATP-dependent DNA ligase
MADAVYDGELYLPGGTSTDVTRLDLQDKLELVLFDLIKVWDGKQMVLADNHNASNKTRRELLEHATRMAINYSLDVAPQFPVSKAGLQAIWDRGGEGAIIKRVTGVRYQPGKRIKDWIKFKKFINTPITITGFLPGKLGECARVVGVTDDGITVRAKARNSEWRAMFQGDPDAYIGRRMNVEHQGRTKKGFRSPMADHLL